MQGNVNEVIRSLEAYIAEHEEDRDQLDSDLLEAGFTKEKFIERSTEFDTTRLNCQFYNYRRKDGLLSDASAIVWLCEEGSGANFGYIAP